MCPPSSAFCVRFDLSKTGEGYHFTKKSKNLKNTLYSLMYTHTLHSQTIYFLNVIFCSYKYFPVIRTAFYTTLRTFLRSHRFVVSK